MSQITNSSHEGSAAASLKTSPKDKFLKLIHAVPWTPPTNTQPSSIEGRVKKPDISPAKELNVASTHLRILSKSERGRFDSVLQQKHPLIPILTKIREIIDDQLFLAGPCIHYIIDPTQPYRIIDLRYPIAICVKDESEISQAIEEKHDFVKENVLRRILDAFPADLSPIELDEQIESRFCILRVGNIKLHICYNVAINESPIEFLHSFSQDYLCIPLDQVLLEKQKKCTLISQMGPIEPLIHSVFTRKLKSKHPEPQMLFEWLEFTALKGYSSSSELRADIVRSYLSAFSLDEVLFHFQSYFACFPVIEQRLCLALLHLVLKEYGIDDENQFKVLPHWLPFIILKNYISTNLLTHSIIEFLNHPKCLELYQELPQELQIFGNRECLEDLVSSMTKRTLMFLSPPERYQFYLFLLFSFEPLFDSLNLQERLNLHDATYSEENFTALYLKNTSLLTSEECTEFLRKIERAHTPVQFAIFGLKVLKQLLELGSLPNKLTACKLHIREPLATTIFEEITWLNFNGLESNSLAQEMILKFINDDLAIDIWEFAQKEQILNQDMGIDLFIKLLKVASIDQRERLWTLTPLIREKRMIPVFVSFLKTKTEVTCSFDDTLITKALKDIFLIQIYPKAIVHFIEQSHLDEQKVLSVLRLLKQHSVLPFEIDELVVTLLSQIKNTSDFNLYKEFKDFLGFSEIRFSLFQKIVSKILLERNFTDSNLLFLKNEFTKLLPHHNQIDSSFICIFDIAIGLITQPYPFIDLLDLEKQIHYDKLALKHFKEALDLFTLSSRNIKTVHDLEKFLCAVNHFFVHWADIKPLYYSQDNMQQVSDLIFCLCPFCDEVTLDVTSFYFSFLEHFILGCVQTRSTKNVLFAAEIFIKSIESKEFPLHCYRTALTLLFSSKPGSIDNFTHLDLYLKIPVDQIFEDRDHNIFAVEAVILHFLHSTSLLKEIPKEHLVVLEALLHNPLISKLVFDNKERAVTTFLKLSILSRKFTEKACLDIHYRMFKCLLKVDSPFENTFKKLFVNLMGISFKTFDVEEMREIYNLFIDSKFFSSFPTTQRIDCMKFFIFRLITGTVRHLNSLLRSPNRSIAEPIIDHIFYDVFTHYEKLLEPGSTEHIELICNMLTIYAGVCNFSSSIFSKYCLKLLIHNPKWTGFFIEGLYKFASSNPHCQCLPFSELRKLFPLIITGSVDHVGAKGSLNLILRLHLQSDTRPCKYDYTDFLLGLSEQFDYSFTEDFEKTFDMLSLT